MNKKIIAKEISFNALKQGYGSVSWIKKDKDNNTGFDILSIQGQKREIVGVKVTEYTDVFTISNAELRAMTESKETQYIIHRYRFNNKRITSFNIYTFDKEKNILIDMVDKTNICTLKPKVLNKDGVQVIVYDCTPQKIKKEIRFY